MAKYHGFAKTQLFDFYRTMTTARVLDDKMLTLLRQGKVAFHVGGAGHEAAQVLGHDHCLIDGAYGSRFLERIAHYLQTIDWEQTLEA